MITFKIEGLSELDRRLREFGPKIARNGLRAANYAGAAVMRDAVRETAPVRTGELRANIRIFKRATPNNVVKHAVGARGKRLKYADTAENRRKRRVGKRYTVDTRNSMVARFLEFGTSKMAARPFMRPAFERSVRPAIEAVRARLEKAVELAAKR
jgi:HK97 gp10 family phage protein